jgi:hypothetical protein
MNRGRVGEERGGKETDGCALTDTLKKVHIMNQSHINVHYFFEDLYTWMYVDGTPMADHIVSMLDIKQQIIDAGKMLKDL